MSPTDILNYIKEAAKTLGAVFLSTTVGGFIGQVVSWLLGVFVQNSTLASLVTNLSIFGWTFPALGATLGFVSAYVYRMRKASA
jgi:hypothetical protein